jgi:hypothetical protein
MEGIEYYELIDGGEQNVYHFLFYMLSGFLISNIKNNIIYYYPNKKDSNVSEGFLSLLPSNFTRHLVKDPSLPYKSFMNAIPIFKDFVLPQSYHLVRDLFKSYVSPLIPGKKTYIQRKGTASRTIINEEELRTMLERVGYTTICLEDHDIKTQIKLVSESEFIIGAHGAGLAFTVFCNQGAKVIELCGKHMNENRHYYHIAHILKHKFIRFQNIVELDLEKMQLNIELLYPFLLEWQNPCLF